MTNDDSEVRPLLHLKLTLLEPEKTMTLLMIIVRKVLSFPNTNGCELHTPIAVLRRQIRDEIYTNFRKIQLDKSVYQYILDLWKYMEAA